jgi:WD40 repeat protein
MNDLVRQTLSEILSKHGRPPLTDSRLCESLLKDYCPESKEEIRLLVGAVREHVAADLSVRQDAVPRHLLRDLLTKRLRKNLGWGSADARWAVESWRVAIRDSLTAESKSASAESDLPARIPGSPHNFADLVLQPKPTLKFGVIGRCQGAVRSVASGPAGDLIVSGGDDATVRLWDLYSGRMETVGRCKGAISSVAFSPSGVLIASASEGLGPTASPTIQLWDRQSGEMFPLGDCGARSPLVIFSPGGKSLASGSINPEGGIRVWNLQTGQMRVLKSGAGGIASMSFSHDGRYIAAADGGLTNPAIRIWDLETGQAEILGQSQRQITAVAFSPDGKSIASGSWDETVRLWPARGGEARVLASNCSCLTCLAYSHTGDRITAASLDGRIRVWEVQSGRARTIGECQRVNAIAFAGNGFAVATGSAEGTVCLWDASRF